jgi:uncharacterized protein (TIGR02217 family)
VPGLSAVDQVLGVGDGIEDTFQFKKTYTRGVYSKVRLLRLPVLSTVLVALDAVAVSSSDYTVDREAGTLTFDTPPGDGVAVTAGFLFDVPVRFEADDSFDQIVRAYETTGQAGLSFWEVRPC